MEDATVTPAPENSGNFSIYHYFINKYVIAVVLIYSTNALLFFTVNQDELILQQQRSIEKEVTVSC